MSDAEATPEVIPVMHAESFEPLARSVGLCRQEGINKVFLINHRGSHGELIENCVRLREEFGDVWLGVNMLDVGSPDRQYAVITELLEPSQYPNAVWSDNAIGRARNELQNTIPLFGGVAFKYTEHYTDSPEEAAALAVEAQPYIDVITTSGPATGHKSDPEKVTAMRSALGKHPLAIASGVDRGNVHEVVAHTDFILVASSIEKAKMSGEIDQLALRGLINAIEKARC